MADFSTMMENIGPLFDSIRKTTVTTTVHKDPYPAISLEKPELNQGGKIVLITGGGTGVGFAIARSFVQASASTVIIVGRRLEVLKGAASKLEEEAKASGTSTKIITHVVDVTVRQDVDQIWSDFERQNIIVDVYVANAAKFGQTKTLFELGTDEVWSEVEANVKSPLYFAEKFYSQKGDKQKFIVNVSTASIHATSHAVVQLLPSYTLSKLSGTLVFQLIAQSIPAEKLQVVSFHPGLIFNSPWDATGISPEQFDNDALCGSFAVWAATPQASFVHGRFLWSTWDVEELASGSLRKRLEEDPYFLRITVAGLHEGLLV